MNCKPVDTIKAAFFDIDGTLLSFATRRVPGFKAVRWNDVFADIIPADGGKTEGMARMLARFGLLG